MNAPLPQHAMPLAFPVEDDSLVVGGLPLPALAARVGSTPFYAYDRTRLDERVALLRRHLPPQVKLHYAIKANPMPALVDHLARRVDGLDVASGRELRVALDSGMTAQEISFAGPGKTQAELAQAIGAGILLNVESFREVRLLGRLSREAGRPARVAVRVNPDFELKSSGMRMGGGPRPFGVDAELVPELMREIGTLGLSFEGLHIYSGSQNLRAPAIVESQHKSVDLAVRLAVHAPAPVRVLNIGGGFGIPYFPGEQPLDLAAVGTQMHALAERTARVLPQATIVIELGRYLVGEAGVYVCRVLDRKISRGQVFLVTDGGLHQHLAASGNFGQVLRKNYPVVIGNRVAGQAREAATVVGPLCTPLDVLAERMDLSVAQPGDLVAVLQSGAYGYTASPIAFLGHPPPVEVLV
jgi:diaminopimelate decarboxylase